MKTLRYLGLILLLTISFLFESNAQQLPQFTQYMFNTISVNPAYAGSREVLNVTALYRDQWLGLEGSPTTGTFSVHTPIKDNKMGLGLSYIRDGLGFESSDFIYADFSYMLQVSQKARLALGVKGGATNYRLDNPDINDPFFGGNNSLWNPNFGLGAYLSTNRWYAGVSAPRILTNQLSDSGFETRERTSYYAIGGLVVDLSLDIKFRPSVIAKFTNGAPATYDATGSFLFYEKLWLGASYRIGDADNFGAFIDYQVTRNIRLGYAYDLPTSTIRPYSGGSHEVILIFEPKGKQTLDLYKSPRYF